MHTNLNQFVALWNIKPLYLTSDRNLFAILSGREAISVINGSHSKVLPWAVHSYKEQIVGLFSPLCSNRISAILCFRRKSSKIITHLFSWNPALLEKENKNVYPIHVTYMYPYHKNIDCNLHSIIFKLLFYQKCLWWYNFHAFGCTANSNPWFNIFKKLLHHYIYDKCKFKNIKISNNVLKNCFAQNGF